MQNLKKKMKEIYNLNQKNYQYIKERRFLKSSLNLTGNQTFFFKEIFENYHYIIQNLYN